MQPFPKLWATPQMGHKTPSKTWMSLPKPEGAEPNHYFHLPHFIRPHTMSSLLLYYISTIQVFVPYGDCRGEENFYTIQRLKNSNPVIEITSPSGATFK